MTRAQQTLWIVGTLAVLGLIFAWLLWPQPDFASMSKYDACEYSAYYSKHGGNPFDCKQEVSKTYQRSLGVY